MAALWDFPLGNTDQFHLFLLSCFCTILCQIPFFSWALLHSPTQLSSTPPHFLLLPGPTPTANNQPTWSTILLMLLMLYFLSPVWAWKHIPEPRHISFYSHNPAEWMLFSSYHKPRHIINQSLSLLPPNHLPHPCPSHSPQIWRRWESCVVTGR